MLLPSFRNWETARSHRPWDVEEANELSELHKIIDDQENLRDWGNLIFGKDAWEELWHDWGEKVSCHGFHHRRGHKGHHDCEKSAVWPAILVGAVILAIILISLCVLCWKRRQQRRIAQQENFQNQSSMYIVRHGFVLTYY